jgi:hypothetical protein
MRLKEALLIQRMVWRSTQPSEPTEKDLEYNRKAVRMLTFIACLNYAMLDLGDELSEAGILRHAVKRRYNMAVEIVQRVHSVAYRMLTRISLQAGREYNDKMDETYSRIQSCVMLQPPERAYNIVLALLRLIGALNKELTCRYDFAPARELAAIPSMLSDCGIKDYGIDNILNVNIK